MRGPFSPLFSRLTVSRNARWIASFLRSRRISDGSTEPTESIQARFAGLILAALRRFSSAFSISFGVGTAPLSISPVARATMVATSRGTAYVCG